MGQSFLKDFDKTMYAISPANNAPKATLVPDANIPHATRILVAIKKIRSLFSFVVIPIIKKATAVAAALQPKLAASLKVEKYLINVPALRICVGRPTFSIQIFSALVKPKVCCFQTQNAEKSAKTAQILKYFIKISGDEMYIQNTKKIYL